MYSTSCSSCLFEPEIIKNSQSSHKMYSNNVVNCQESTTILNVNTKKSGNLSYAPRILLVVQSREFFENYTGYFMILICNWHARVAVRSI